MAFLEAHPNVQLHYTPTYASWLNQVALWFAKVKRDLLTRRIFTSVTDLARKLRRSSPNTMNARSRFGGPMSIPVDASHNSRNDRYSPRSPTV
jgi:hypothetical protein